MQQLTAWNSYKKEADSALALLKVVRIGIVSQESFHQDQTHGTLYQRLE
jgi:hypothetical protein